MRRLNNFWDTALQVLYFWKKHFTMGDQFCFSLSKGTKISGNMFFSGGGGVIDKLILNTLGRDETVLGLQKSTKIQILRG